MKVRIEVENGGTSVLSILHQKSPFADDGSILRVLGPDGKPSRYVNSGPWETLGEGVSLIADGETLVLFDQVDLASYYYIDKPGRYQIQVMMFDSAEVTLKDAPGPVIIPSSNVLELAIEPGELSHRDAMIRELLPVMPEGWVVLTSTELKSQRGVYARLCNHPYRGTGIVPLGVRCIDVSETETELPQTRGRVYLGRNSRGHIHISTVLSDKDFSAWSDASEAIARALGAAK